MMKVIEDRPITYKYIIAYTLDAPDPCKEVSILNSVYMEGFNTLDEIVEWHLGNNPKTCEYYLKDSDNMRKIVFERTQEYKENELKERIKSINKQLQQYKKEYERKYERKYTSED